MWYFFTEALEARGYFADISFGPAVGFPAGPEMQGLAVADFNRDGHNDAALTNYGAGTVSILPGDGPGGFGARAACAAVGELSGATAADLNADGHVDLVTLFEGNGDGTLAAGQNVNANGGPADIAITDLEGDATPDFAIAQSIAVNGDFESPTVTGLQNGQGETTADWYFAGDTFGNWTVEAGSIDLIREPVWQAGSGSQSVDLSGQGAGIIYQDLATTPGQSYTIAFMFAGNPAPREGDSVKRLDLYWGETLVASPSFDITGHSEADLGWVQLSYDVIATSTTTRLRFQSLENSRGGPAIDNVTVSTPFATLDGGVLTVTGTDSADAIAMTVFRGNVRISVNGVVEAFDATTVNRIELAAGAGNDFVTMGPSIPETFVDAGFGNDVVLADPGLRTSLAITGSTGNDTIVGGAGDDEISGSLGNDRILGGTGHDFLLGGAGNDYLNGEVGDDICVGGGGNDRLFAGAGTDFLIGGTGDDFLDGTSSAGADGVDSLSGNDGDDTGFADIGDIVSGVEHLTQG